MDLRVTGAALSGGRRVAWALSQSPAECRKQGGHLPHYDGRHVFGLYEPKTGRCWARIDARSSSEADWQSRPCSYAVVTGTPSAPSGRIVDQQEPSKLETVLERQEAL